MLAQHANIFERLEQSLEPAVRGYEKFCRLLSAAGMAVFMLMVTLTFADVFLRYFFHYDRDECLFSLCRIGEKGVRKFFFCSFDCSSVRKKLFPGEERGVPR